MNPEELAALQEMLGTHEVSQSGAANVVMDDPERLETIQTVFNLSPEEAEQLAVPGVEGGPSLASRLESLRPGMNIGPLELTLDGSFKEPRVEGRIPLN